MLCRYCSCHESKVVETRSLYDDTKLRRRRECINCGRRFTTYEIIENEQPVVVKKDNSRQSFDREKIFKGLLRACEKRPVTYAQMEELVSDIEAALSSENKKEVSSREIGDMILCRLLKIDEISYIRFASVYKQFDNIQSFLQEVKNISK